MPRYYFDIYNDEISIDEKGAELDNPFAALGYAVKAARGLAQATVEQGYLAADHYVEILDADRNPIEAVKLGDVVEIRRNNWDCHSHVFKTAIN